MMNFECSSTEELLPDRLQSLWHEVEEMRLSRGEFHREQESLISEYRRIWAQALLLDGFKSLEDSMVSEIASYAGEKDLDKTRDRCRCALSNIKQEWHAKVDHITPEAVERFYDGSDAMIYELMWWHTLGEDLSPLAYVVAMKFAKRQGCRDCLDFGSGVGSGGILFMRNGFQVTLADISSAALAFSRTRFKKRELSAVHIDLKVSELPEAAFDMVTAMDVFEHLVDPVETIGAVWRSLKKGGFLFGRFHAEQDVDRPHHVTLDFNSTFNELKKLGFCEVWRDQWLWGHQIFQKR